MGLVGGGPKEFENVGSGANLAAINAVRFTFERDSTATYNMSLGWLETMPPRTKAKVRPVVRRRPRIALGDGGGQDDPVRLPRRPRPEHRSAEHLLGRHDAEDRPKPRPAGGNPRLHDSEHTNISGDTLRAQFMRSRHLQNAIGVTGGDDVAWRGGLETSYANMKIVNSFFRSGGTTSQRAV